MDELTAELEAADDEDEFLSVIRRRISTIAARNEEIQAEIADRQDESKSLAAELAVVETELVEQADASVEPDVEALEDITALPPDVVPEIDPELLERAIDVRDRVMANHEATDAATVDLREELEAGTEELALYREITDDLERDSMTMEEARTRVLDRLDR